MFEECVCVSVCVCILCILMHLDSSGCSRLPYLSFPTNEILQKANVTFTLCQMCSLIY